jgi:glutathione peroxidase
MMTRPLFLLALMTATACAPRHPAGVPVPTVYDFTAKTIDGAPQKLDSYKGKPLLIVNVASKCGFTPQYTGLEAMYRKFKDQGLVILGFPCDQFGHQEPGNEQEIKTFCSMNYDVTFPLFSKIHVNGDDADPLYKFLESEAPGLLGSKSIKWNFTKFLIDKSGKVVRRYGPTDKPESIEKDIAAVL